MSRGTVFTSNRTQNVRIPADVRFPDDVKNVFVRAVGNERILVPIENARDSFFLDGPTVSEDFMDERASQEQTEREDF